MSARSVAQGADPWPPDKVLIGLFREYQHGAIVARACEKSRESLRDYLLLREDLRTLCYTAAGREPPPTRRENEARRADRARRYVLRQRPEQVEYANLVRRDPCSYCGALMPIPGDLDLRNLMTLDHIEPKVRGGDEHWSNYTGACGRCNGEKNGTPLLQFMLERLGQRMLE